jgi:hypothetical protein
MKKTTISRRKFIQLIAFFAVLFSLRGATNFLDKKDTKLKPGGYGTNGYGN